MEIEELKKLYSESIKNNKINNEEFNKILNNILTKEYTYSEYKDIEIILYIFVNERKKFLINYCNLNLIYLII